MIAALLAVGLVAVALAWAGGRLFPALAPAPARLAFGGIGLAFLLAAGTSAFLARLPAPGTAPSTAAAPANAQRIQRVMVVIDDTLPGAAPRDSRAVQAALASLRTELQRAGFTVQEGRVALLNDQQDNVRRSDAEIVQLARRQSQAAFDAVVLLTTQVSIDFAIQAQTPYLRGKAVALRGADGRNLGTFDWVSPTRTTMPYACDRACMLENLATEAPLAGTTLAANMIAALNAGAATAR